VKTLVRGGTTSLFSQNTGGARHWDDGFQVRRSDGEMETGRNNSPRACWKRGSAGVRQGGRWVDAEKRPRARERKSQRENPQLCKKKASVPWSSGGRKVAIPPKPLKRGDLTGEKVREGKGLIEEDHHHGPGPDSEKR